VEDQPDPERECEECIEIALQKGHSMGIGLATDQILRIRSYLKIGYRYEPEDLRHWQWQALVAIDQTIDEYHAEKIKHGKDNPSISTN